jgi:regulator of sigma E protease
MGAAKGESILFKIKQPNGTVREAHLVPRRSPEDKYPLVGINPIHKLTLPKVRSADGSPVVKDSPAGRARAVQDGSAFQGGDKIIGVTDDPRNPTVVRPIPDNDPTVFDRALQQMRGLPMTVSVDRGGTPLDFPLQPDWSRRLPGVRFQMGRLAAVRFNGPAARAVAVGGNEPRLQTTRFDAPETGDRIIAVEVADEKGRHRFVDEVNPKGEAGAVEEQFDPLKLGYDLEEWAKKATDLTVRVTVLRAATDEAKTGKRTTFEMTWDPALVNSGEQPSGMSGPAAISGLGLAYYVNTVVDAANPAAGAALARGDVIKEARPKQTDRDGTVSDGKWFKLKQYQAVYFNAVLQSSSTDQIDVKVTRADGSEQELTLTIAADPTWPAVDRGFVFLFDTRVQQAEGPWSALRMGWHRTVRTVRVIYQTLYATIFRQISAETMSGPLQIANASYTIAGNDIWQFIIFIGLININLAVVNFLPIPLLDGGHMVFLIYERVRGKPAPEKLQEYSMWGGLAFILLLMGFVTFLDVRKLFF